MSPQYRKGLLCALLCAYAVQTALIYTDRAGTACGPLSPAALAGRAVWQQSNCQTCHQIYGFGGHLAPDLTNRASLLGPAGLRALLASPPRQMPLYRLSAAEIDDLYAFLREISATGVSVSHGSRLKLSEIPWFTFAR